MNLSENIPLGSNHDSAATATKSARGTRHDLLKHDVAPDLEEVPEEEAEAATTSHGI